MEHKTLLTTLSFNKWYTNDTSISIAYLFISPKNETRISFVYLNVARASAPQLTFPCIPLLFYIQSNELDHNEFLYISFVFSFLTSSHFHSFQFTLFYLYQTQKKKEKQQTSFQEISIPDFLYPKFTCKIQKKIIIDLIFSFLIFLSILWPRCYTDATRPLACRHNRRDFSYYLSGNGFRTKFFIRFVFILNGIESDNEP